MNKKDFSQPIYLKAFVETLNKEAGDSGILGECVITSSAVDRDQDIITADGWDFTNFEKNPVLLWSHNSGFDENRPSIGKVINVRQQGSKWFFTPQFDMEDEFARMIYSKFQRGFLNAFSIGFMALEFEERKGEWGYIITKKEALEFSAVNVPANPEALVQRSKEEKDNKIQYSKSWSEWSKGIKIPTETKEHLCKIHSEEKGQECPLTKEGSVFNLESLKSEQGNYDFEKVKTAMVALMSAKGEELTLQQWKRVHEELSSIYQKSFSRLAPSRTHFMTALEKVAEGKTIEEKKKSVERRVKSVSKKTRLVKALSIVASELNVTIKGKGVHE